MRAAWSWWNLAELTVSGDKKPLRVNLDETACRLHYEQRAGLVFATGSRVTDQKERLVQDVSTKKRRGGFTHIAMICDDASIQPRLPQILLGNERIFPKSLCQRVRGKLAPNILLWRRKTGWVTKPLMREVLAQLLTSLGELTATHQVILLLDTAPVHICKRFLRQASMKGVIVQYVPAKLTWLLQPLDTHAFARYKKFLSEEYRRHLLDSQDGRVDVEAIIHIVGKTCLKVLQGVAWAYAFDGNGFGARQSRARASILAHAEWSSLPELTARVPTYEEVASIFPTRLDIPLRELLDVFKEGSDGVSWTKAPSPCLAIVPCPPPDGNIWRGRLRSSSQVHLAMDGTHAGQDSAAASSDRPARAHSLPSDIGLPGPSDVLPRPRPLPVGRPLFMRRRSA